ncbi:MAG: ABC transporter permease, partial [Methanoregula sp.]|nr:ABC transporter permease [Methanoregula sp.]
MSYLIYVAMFGAAVVIFLWLRDARIFFRTGLSGYRKAAYWG